MVTYGNYKYSIDENFHIRAWRTEQDETTEAPFIFQYTKIVVHEDATAKNVPFESYEDATIWIENELNKLEARIQAELLVKE